MPGKLRVVSAASAVLVGLVVVGLILFGTDPLGMATTDIAVPAPQAAAASRAPVVSEPGDQATSKPHRHHRAKRHVTRSVRPWQHSYRPTPKATASHLWTSHRPRPRYTPSTVHPTVVRTTSTPVSSRPTAAPSTTKTTTRPSATPTATQTSATPTPKASATTTAASRYTVRQDWAAAVLSRLNSQRAQHGLPALTSNAKLVASAHRHNLAMADANQLSHQLSGEPGLGTRISAAGYSWSSVGENIAYNSNRSQAGVLALQDAMYNETAPNDGHRRNILSSSFTDVGVDILDDPVHGKVWLVTDFGRG